MEMEKDINILIACEESQRVANAFRDRGFTAFSCDIQECSGGHPEYHIKDDVLKIIDGNCSFTTMTGEKYYLNKRWNLIIAHPPCTYLSNAGARHLYPRGELNYERYLKGLAGGIFFLQLYSAQCNHICIENPIPSRIFNLPPYSQIIQPYEYGHPFKKATGLWLKNLPKLLPTNIINVRESTKIAGNWYNKGGKERPKNRAKTFPGIAEAMAKQWGDYLLKEVNDERI